jgi:hypothetical protein
MGLAETRDDGQQETPCGDEASRQARDEVPEKTDISAITRGDVTTEHPGKPEVSEMLQKLCSWAVISMLNFHPRKEGMPPTLVYKTEENSSYQVQNDPREHGTMEDIMSAAHDQLARIAEEETLQAYALIVDSLEDVSDIPTRRSIDGKGEVFPEDQPTIFVYLGEKATEQGVFVVQAYRGRIVRGGAIPLDAPLILEGPTSLIWSEDEGRGCGNGR